MSVTRMSHLLVDILKEIAKQNSVTNTRLRGTGKQNKLTFKEFVIWITRASHLINNKMNQKILNKICKQNGLMSKRLREIGK